MNNEQSSDLGNAQRLRRLHGDDLRFVQMHGRWMWWDGSCWRADTTGEVFRRAKTVALDLYQEAAIAPTDADRIALGKAALRAESEKSISAMIKLAKSERPIAAETKDFDCNPWLLNTPKGMVDLRIGDLHPHERAAMCTRITGAGYVPGARSDLWEKCLETWLPDPEVRDFVQRAVGYSLIGEVREHVLLILWGSGANGKTVFTQTILRVLGEYAVQTPAETLITNRSSSIPNDLARLVGVRFVAATESEENGRLSEGRIKAMTGGDRIAARFMRAEWFEFDPTFTVWLSTNHMPVVRGTDEGIWRRIKLIPFDVRIPEDQRDPELASKLAAELEGVMTWAIEGALKYQEIGLSAPNAVQAATEDYRNDQDVIGAFLDDECELRDGAHVEKNLLFEAFERWNWASKERVITKSAFGRKIKERGFKEVRDARARSWIGLGIRQISDGGLME